MRTLPKIVRPWVAALVLALGAPELASAQVTTEVEPPELWLVARADTVLVLIPETPEPNEGFVVYRTAAGGEPELITPTPVVPVRRPGLALALMGDRAEEIRDVLRAQNDVQLLRRLGRDEFRARTLSALYRPVAQVLGRLHVDAGVEPGTSYEYRVVFVDDQGMETEESRTAFVVVEDVAPGVATSVEAEPDDGRVTLSWQYPPYEGDPLDFTVGFHLYRSEAGAPFQKITRAPVVRVEGTPLEFLDRDARNGVEFRYTVRALDMAGREGVPTEPVSVTPADPRPPAPARELVTETGDGLVRLVWRLAPEPDVEGYLVERSLGLSEPYEEIGDGLVPADSPLFTDSTAVGGTRYFYRITVVDSAGGRSTPGTPVVAVPFDNTPPDPPGDPSVDVVAERQVRVSWPASPSSDVEGYHLYRGEDLDRLVRITDEPVADTTFLDPGFEGDGLAPGGRYVVRVTAVDRSTNESTPTEAIVAVPDDEAPEAATAVRAVNERGRRVEVRWNASPSRDVARYLLYRGVETSEAEPLDSLSGGVGPFLVRDSAVSRGTTYRYELVAVDSAGNRSPAVEASVLVRDFDPPPAPRFAEAVATEAGVRVVWERVVAPDLAGYRVFRATSPTGVYEPVSDLLPPEEERSFVDRAGRANHHYVVRAIDESGNESASSPATSPPGGTP